MTLAVEARGNSQPRFACGQRAGRIVRHGIVELVGMLEQILFPALLAVGILPARQTDQAAAGGEHDHLAATLYVDAFRKPGDVREQDVESDDP